MRSQVVNTHPPTAIVAMRPNSGSICWMKCIELPSMAQFPSIVAATRSAQRFDLAGGALGGIGGDPLEHPQSLLEALHVALQRLVFLAERGRIGFRDAAAAVGQRVAVAGADPIVHDPGDRPDGDR